MTSGRWQPVRAPVGLYGTTLSYIAHWLPSWSRSSIEVLVPGTSLVRVQCCVVRSRVPRASSLQLAGRPALAAERGLRGERRGGRSRPRPGGLAIAEKMGRASYFCGLTLVGWVDAGWAGLRNSCKTRPRCG